MSNASAVDERVATVVQPVPCATDASWISTLVIVLAWKLMMISIRVATTAVSKPTVSVSSLVEMSGRQACGLRPGTLPYPQYGGPSACSPSKSPWNLLETYVLDDAQTDDAHCVAGAGFLGDMAPADVNVPYVGELVATSVRLALPPSSTKSRSTAPAVVSSVALLPTRSVGSSGTGGTVNDTEYEAAETVSLPSVTEMENESVTVELTAAAGFGL